MAAFCNPYYEWLFNESLAEKFEYLYDAGLFDEIKKEIIENTDITIVYTDLVRTTKEITEDEWFDSVNIASKIIEKYYLQLKQNKLEDIY